MRPLILITNDDGIHSPGLHGLVEAVHGLGDILISAPVCQQTGMGRSLPALEDTGIIDEIGLDIAGNHYTAYGVHGSPAYCVSAGVLELASRKPDLCLSGINYGENLGKMITTSGTVGAILEADSYGIPGIAVSAQADMSSYRTMDYQDYNWETANAAARKWAAKMLKGERINGADMLNINIPMGAELCCEEKITSQSSQNYFVFQKPGKRDFSKPFRLKCEIDVRTETLEEGSDIRASYINKKISVTPLKDCLSV